MNTNKIALIVLIAGAVGGYIGYKIGCNLMYNTYGDVLDSEVILYLAARDSERY